MAIGRDYHHWLDYGFGPRNGPGDISGSRLVADLIAERLAQCEPVVGDFDGSSYCALCDVRDPAGGTAEVLRGLEEHAITCPWRMAKELHQ